MLFSFGRNGYYFVECHIIFTGKSCMPQIQHFLKKCWHSFEQTCSFSFLMFKCSLYNVTGWKKHSCSHALYLENTSLRRTNFSNSMYDWNIQYFPRKSLPLPLVRHHSYNNQQYAIQGRDAPSRKCTAYSWRIQPVFVQYSLQPIISFERGSNYAEHAISFSTCACIFIFTKVHDTIHCRKQGCFQDAWSSPKKTRYSSLCRKCISKSFSCAVMCHWKN